jgi:hypothetical protein
MLVVWATVVHPMEAMEERDEAFTGRAAVVEGFYEFL